MRRFFMRLNRTRSEIAVTTDPLTGLRSVRALDGVALQTGQIAALLDIDGLRYVNDERGMPLSDSVLRIVGNLAVWHTSPTGSSPYLSWAYRVGDDEFLILWEDRSPGEARAQLANLRAALVGTGLGLSVSMAASRVLAGESGRELARRLSALLTAEPPASEAAPLRKGRPDQFIFDVQP